MQSDAQKSTRSERAHSDHIHESAVALEETDEALDRELDCFTSKKPPALLPTTSSMTLGTGLGGGAAGMVRRTSTDGIMQRTPSQDQRVSRIAINDKNPLGLDSATLELVRSADASGTARKSKGAHV